VRRAALSLVGVIGLVAAGNASAAPLIPRELVSLARHSHTLVQLQRAGAERVEPKLRAAGGEVVSRRLGIWRMPSPAAQQVIPRLAIAGALREFEPDFPRVPVNHGDAGDPLLPQEWWLSHIGADRVDAPGPGRPVTVIDTGIDLTHPEFAGRPNTVALNRQRLAGRRDFHGTAVASVVGAPANGVGIVGVYPGALLRSWDASPNGILTSADVIAGIGAAASGGPGVISLSLGGFFQSRLERQAILDAVERGSIVVAASGNERESGSPLAFPANLPHVVTVGSSDEFDRVSAFSSAATGMDLVAPGENVAVAVPLWQATSGYDFETGTSFSAPIVAGAIAWVWTARPELDSTQIVELMRRSARDIAPSGPDRDSGFGLLDIAAALTRPTPLPDPREPNDEIDHVRPNGLFAVGKHALTDPGRPRAAITARVDITDDPRDIYRAWVPAGRRVTATLQSGRMVELRQLGTRPRGVSAVSSVEHLGKRVVTLTNRSQVGAYLYLNAYLPQRAGFRNASYTLSLTTTRVPR
jgi:hypothetical protein